MSKPETKNLHLMPLGVNRESPSPIYQQISAQLKKELLLGGYKEGDRFFSYRKLKDIYGIELRTASEAIDLLIKENFLVKKRASGTYVGNLDRALRNGTFTGNVWYVLIGTETFDHPYYFRLLKSIERRIGPTGLKLIVGIKESFDNFFSWFTPMHGDGVILTGNIDNRSFLKSVNKRVEGRLITLGAYTRTDKIANISVDIENGIQKALGKLRSLNVRSMAVIAGSRGKHVTEAIIDAASSFAAENGIEVTACFTDEEEDGWKAMKSMPGHLPDCVIATEPAFPGVCRYALEKNISCPEKLKIIRYGKEPLNRIYDDFSFVDIYSDTEQMGRTAVEMLLSGRRDKIEMKLEISQNQ